MSDDYKTSIRIKNKANTARQYAEGIMDLLLYDTKIYPHLTEKEKIKYIDPEKRNRTKCIDILEKYYSLEIASKLKIIFKDLGNTGSHFSGEVQIEQLKEQRNLLCRIIEDVFVQYFLDSNHLFGSENIFTLFGMLTLNSRIYILEKLYTNYQNIDVIDRLTLAYVKNDELQKAIDFLMQSYSNEEIDGDYYFTKVMSLTSMYNDLADVQRLNSENLNSGITIMKQSNNGLWITGYPSNKNIFEIQKAVICFKSWFDSDKDKYPEFINLFFSLMIFDNRIVKESDE
jgi:hypothetical protein